MLKKSFSYLNTDTSLESMVSFQTLDTASLLIMSSAGIFIVYPYVMKNPWVKQIKDKEVSDETKNIARIAFFAIGGAATLYQICRIGGNMRSFRVFM